MFGKNPKTNMTDSTIEQDRPRTTLGAGLNEEFEWTTAKCNDVIDLWQTHPCLFQTTCKEYHNRNVKSRSIEQIATVLQTTGRCLNSVLSVTVSHCLHTCMFLRVNYKVAYLFPPPVPIVGGSLQNIVWLS